VASFQPLKEGGPSAVLLGNANNPRVNRYTSSREEVIFTTEKKKVQESKEKGEADTFRRANNGYLCDTRKTCYTEGKTPAVPRGGLDQKKKKNVPHRVGMGRTFEPRKGLEIDFPRRDLSGGGLVTEGGLFGLKA